MVVGYADSYPEAHALAARTRQEGPVRTRLEQDGCGRVRVAVDRRLTIGDARAFLSAAREVVGVNDEVTPEEGSLLAHIAVRFG